MTSAPPDEPDPFDALAAQLADDDALRQASREHARGSRRVREAPAERPPGEAPAGRARLGRVDMKAVGVVAVVLVLVGAGVLLRETGDVTRSRLGAGGPVLGAQVTRSAGVAGLRGSSDGTCFDLRDGDQYQLVVRDCDDSHVYELLGTVQVTDDGAYPDEPRWQVVERNGCNPLVRDWTGYPGALPAGLGPQYFRPQPDGWDVGDRTVYCTVRSQEPRKGSVHHLSDTVPAPSPPPGQA